MYSPMQVKKKKRKKGEKLKDIADRALRMGYRFVRALFRQGHDSIMRSSHRFACARYQSAKSEAGADCRANSDSDCDSDSRFSNMESYISKLQEETQSIGSDDSDQYYLRSAVVSLDMDDAIHMQKEDRRCGEDDDYDAFVEVTRIFKGEDCDSEEEEKAVRDIGSSMFHVCRFNGVAVPYFDLVCLAMPPDLWPRIDLYSHLKRMFRLSNFNKKCNTSVTRTSLTTTARCMQLNNYREVPLSTNTTEESKGMDLVEKALQQSHNYDSSKDYLARCVCRSRFTRPKSNSLAPRLIRTYYVDDGSKVYRSAKAAARYLLEFDRPPVRTYNGRTERSTDTLYHASVKWGALDGTEIVYRSDQPGGHASADIALMWPRGLSRGENADGSGHGKFRCPQLL